MHMMKWILAILAITALIVFSNLPGVKIRWAYRSYRTASSSISEDRVIRKAKRSMRPASLPYVIDIYKNGTAIKFAASMVGTCRGIEADNTLRRIARAPETAPLARTICLAHLLSRGHLEVWEELTEADIDTICSAPPFQVVFWKTLLLNNTGYTHRAFLGDTHPEHRRMRNLFAECIETHELRVFQEKMRNK